MEIAVILSALTVIVGILATMSAQHDAEKAKKENENNK